MKKLVVVALLLAACAAPKHQEPVQAGEPFLPAYLAMLQGKRPWPQNPCGEPHDLASLLIPCDKEGDG